jgi:putative transcriptional regulator
MAPSIQNRIAVLRAERGLSRQQLADALGINYQTVGYLERSEYNPSLELAFRIAEYFGLPLEAVFSRQPFVPMSSQLYGKEESA